MFGLNNWIWSGVVLYVLGKILKIKILDTVGFWFVIIGIISMVAGFIGFGLPF